MLLVVGTQLDQAPRFWQKGDEWYLRDVTALMLTYADFHKKPVKRRKAMELGLRDYLGVSSHVRVYLDNGSFAFSRNGEEAPVRQYIEFVHEAKPDWYPIPTDYIPSPRLARDEQRSLFEQTMRMNTEYVGRGFIPVMHAGDWLEEYLVEFDRNGLFDCKDVALGGLVPRLLSGKGSRSRTEVVDAIKRVRGLVATRLHAFGIGGLGTLHLAAALGLDSVDSVGWRNRAARGLILLPGRGERSVVPLGNWRGVEVSREEERTLSLCPCPACQRYGVEGLRARNSKTNKCGRGDGASGFNRRAVHNLWMLLEESREIEARRIIGGYRQWCQRRLADTLLRSLIEYCFDQTST